MMKNQTHKRIVFLLCICLVFTTFVSCGKPQPQASAKPAATGTSMAMSTATTEGASTKMPVATAGAQTTMAPGETAVTTAALGVATTAALGVATTAAPGVATTAAPGVATTVAPGVATTAAPGVATTVAPGVVTTVAPGGVATTAAPDGTVPQDDDAWKKAYLDFMVQKKWNTERKAMYKLINIDNDAIPELYIDSQLYTHGSVLCSYYNGTVIFQQMDVGGLTYVEGKNFFVNSGRNQTMFYDIIYKIEAGQFVKVHEGKFGYLHNTVNQDGNKIYDYYWDGERCSAKLYREKWQKAYPVEQVVNLYATPAEETFFSYDAIVQQIMAAP